MPIATDSYNLSLTQNDRILKVRCSQSDSGRTVNFSLYNHGNVFTIPTGISASIAGVKANGGIFTKQCSISNNQVVATLDTTITNVAGVCVAEIVLTNTSGERFGTSNFIINVEQNPLLWGKVQVSEEAPIDYIADFVNALESLNARVNNILTPSGEASLSEVVDARLSVLNPTSAYSTLRDRINADVNNLSTNKADKSTTYTKTEVDNLLDNVEIDIDDELDDTSENPVQNKVIYQEISGVKADLEDDVNDLKSALNANTNAGGALDILQFETTGGKDSALYVIEGRRYYLQNVTPDGVTKASAQLYVKGNSGSAVQIPTNGNKFSYLAPSSGVLRIYCTENAPGAVYLYMHGRVETKIEDINTKIGSSNMGTTATTVTGAVAEHTQNINTASARIDGLFNSSGAISKLSFSGTGSQDSGIFVKAGNKYTLENVTPTDLTTVSAQIYVVGQSGSAVALGASYGAKVTYTAPADGILRVYNTTSGGGNLHLYVHGHLQTEIDAIVDDINNEEYNLFSIFGNFGACGDSLISGVIEGSQEGTSVTKYNLSWASQLANICHNDYTHYSEGGLTAKAWLTTFGSSVASKDSYIVALGTNDYNNPNMPLGTSADIGTTAESFYRYYGEIVSLLKTTNSNAKIFVCSIYRGEGERVDWNNAIKYFADNYSNVYYVDFSNMTADFGAYKNGSHFSAMGYKMIAVRASKLISDIIQNNFSEFRYVGF